MTSIKQLPGFCPKLWTGFDLTTIGGISPCCFWNPVHYLGNSLKGSNLETVLGKSMESYRKDVLLGKKLEQCRVCWEQESRGLRSQRIEEIENLSEGLENRISCSENQDDRYPITAVTLRFSNRCNLKCMMCGDYNSSSWETFFKVKRSINSEELQEEILKYLRENLRDLREIYLAGGEPVLIDSCWKVLDLLIEQKATWVELKYNTNITTLVYKGQNILDRWKEWLSLGGSLSIGLSIDAVGKAAEACRSGCTWSVVDNNVKQLLELQPLGRVNIYVSPCIGTHNVLYIPELVRVAIREWNLPVGAGTFGNILIHPPHLSLQNLPNIVKDVVRLELEQDIEKEIGDCQVHKALTCFLEQVNQYMKVKKVKDLSETGMTSSDMEAWYLDRYPKWLELGCKISRWWWWCNDFN